MGRAVVVECDPYNEDNSHVRPEPVDKVMELFERYVLVR